ncbi:hypothetical protein G7Y89_g1405 [Cudoniella acicularis]|uniref:Uncharacterized protein n=1 Tax=Cudoniella acicularis TaxID=354080 RepID=A0A8H4RWZ7_9HELO|nr:hypothetical protein G7Y89_g1405 [Cudoniella acicularis]
MDGLQTVDMLVNISASFHQKLSNLFSRAGLGKRSVMAAFAAGNSDTITKSVIDLVTLDPGIGSQIDHLEDCPEQAGFLNYASWAIQVGATSYAIFVTIFVWAQDGKVQNEPAWLQFPLLLGVLNINRESWVLAVLGIFVPGKPRTKRKWLITTTFIALCIDWVFISCAFVMTSHIAGTNPPRHVYLLSWILPGVEGTVSVAGLIAGFWNVHYIGSWWIPFLPGALWLALGPLFIIGLSVASHFDPMFLVTT